MDNPLLFLLKNMKQQNNTTLHVINHTHWDREWFVPFTFTRRWISQLINNLEEVVAANPDYQFFFDAQTMVIDDLQSIDPEAYGKACELIRNKNLVIGPYYAQPDMRMSGAESLVRNLRLGIDRASGLGGVTDFAAWQVDIFGHVSQSPQIHRHFGVDTVYLWRGPDCLEPFFWWEGADGTTMLAVDLFAGGYRNFYRVTTDDNLALPRLEHEVRKLRPFYPLGHIPVFDGFDLDSEPGDAGTYFATRHAEYLAKQGIQVVNSSPLEFAQKVRNDPIALGLPTMSGELISGKYSSVFPGTLSARVYSKLAIGHAERLLYRYAEPLSSLLPADQYPHELLEDQSKQILQNLVHDVISGCSIDQVHQIAELRTQSIHDTLQTKTAEVLDALSGTIRNGVYAYLPATGETNQHIAHNGKLYNVVGKGVGITKVAAINDLPDEIREVDEFTWKNEHFEATMRADGSLRFDDSGRFGQLVVRSEEGDTYWDEPRGEVKSLTVQSPLQIRNETDGFAQVSFVAELQAHAFSVRASVTVTFDDSPLVRWEVKLASTGAGFSVMLRHSYDASPSKLNVGMQFDNVERAFQDTNLLGRNLDPSLSAVLNDSSQRDLIQTFTFPFHSYISPILSNNRVHVLAKSLRAYQTEQPGHIDLVLSRPVDWLMKPSHHEYHSGDAGPKFYVPDARCERETTIECALLVSDTGPDDIRFHQAVDQYICNPLLFEVEGSSATESHLLLFDEPAVISALHVYKGKRLARMYNPTGKPLPLLSPRTTLTQNSEELGSVAVLNPRAITTVDIGLASDLKEQSAARATMLNWPDYPVGPDNSSPDPAMVEQLKAMQSRLQHELDALAALLKTYDNDPPHNLQHRFYVVARECMETQLSLLWNKRRAEQPSKMTLDYAAAEADRELYELATRYNGLRIMRRMYDYIIGIDGQDRVIARPDDSLAPSQPVS